MKIQVHRMYKFDTDRPLKAFVDVIVGGSLLVKGLRVMEGHDGLFVSMPREQAKDSKWYDTVRCLTESARDTIREVVLEAYDGRIANNIDTPKSLGDKLVRKYNKRKEL